MGVAIPEVKLNGADYKHGEQRNARRRQKAILWLVDEIPDRCTKRL